MTPCPKCESIDVEINSIIGIKMSGNIVETTIACNTCNFSTPILTLWSEDEIKEESTVFKKAEKEAEKIWEQYRDLNQSEG